MKVGDRVERSDGSHHDIIRITEDSGIQLSDGHYYCRSELKLVDNKPTKIELIDKAIDDLDGDISKVQFYNCQYHSYLKYDTTYAYNYVLCHKDSFSVTDCLCFCTIEEFEQRKKERELMNWFDYENQKMLKSPPVGEIVLVRMDSGKEYRAKVLEITHNTDREIFIVRVFNGVVEGVGDLVYKDKAKPLDWDKLSKRKQAIAYAMELSPDWAKLEDIFGSLYDAGVLKSPE
jgi:hypothetical protein